MCFISTNKQPISYMHASKQSASSENWSLNQSVTVLCLFPIEHIQRLSLCLLTWPPQTHALSHSPLEVLSERHTSCWDEEKKMVAQKYIEEGRKADRAAHTQPYLYTHTHTER